METQGIPWLVLALWWAEPDFWVGGCWDKVLRFSVRLSAHWLVWPVLTWLAVVSGYPKAGVGHW